MLGAFAGSMALFMVAAWSDQDVASISENTEGNVRYVTGGIGEDEANLFESEAQQYPLELQFLQKSIPTNQFLANINVTIQNRQGSIVLDTTTDGPYLLADLPAGKYEIKAEYDGNAMQRTVWLHHGKHAHVVFLWPAASENNY